MNPLPPIGPFVLPSAVVTVSARRGRCPSLVGVGSALTRLCRRQGRFGRMELFVARSGHRTA